MRSVYWLLLISFALFLLTACGQNTPQVLPTPVASPTPVPPTTTPIAGSVSVGQAQPTLDPNARPGTIRIVHAAADTPTLNMYAGFLTVATNLDFAQSTEPTPLDAGDYPIQIAPSGSRPGDTPLFETLYTLESGASDIVVVAKNEGQLELLTFPEAILPLNEGESIITLINAVSGASDVTIQQNDTNLTDPIPFGQSVNTAVLPSGATSLSIQAGGSTTTYDIDLEERQHYTLILAGQADQVNVASFSTPAPGRTAVRTINASETLGAVDVYLDDTLLAGGAEFSRPSPRQNMISGDYNVRVYPTGADQAADAPLTSQTLSFDAGQNIALLILGTTRRVVLVPYSEDLSQTPPGQARIAFLNTLESVATLHVETSGGALPDVPDTGFGQPPEDTLLNAESHNFYSTRAGATEANQTVETVQNVLLEQGTYYLYMVTGRSDNQPIILSEDVGIDETLAVSSDEEENIAAADNPIELRFINAIADQTAIDFQINDTPGASNLPYGQGSQFIPITEPSATISAVVTGSNEFLQSSETGLESGNRYTVIAYGPDRQNVQLLVVPDAGLIFDGSSPHLRLINLSANVDTGLGLGFSPQDPTPLAGTSIPPDEGLRRSIPGGVQRLVDDIGGGSFSSAILMPVGIYDMEIIDSNTNQLATTIPNIELAGGAHYDVIVYEAPDSIRISGFVVPYPIDAE